MKPLAVIFLLLCAFTAQSQLYVPNGVIGSNTTNQNIGIGISNPPNLLTVYGPGSLSTTFQQKITNGTNVLALGANSTAAEIQSQGGVPLYLNKGGNNVILDHATTNLGLGTSQPSEKLEIHGRLKISDPTGGGSNIIVSNGYGGAFNASQDYTYIAKFKGNTVNGAYNAMVVTGGIHGGNIGIGTDTPLKKLHLKNGDFMSSDNSFDNINVRVTGSFIPEIRFTRWTGGDSDQHNAFIGQFFNTSLGGEYSLGLGTGRSLSGDQNATNMVLTATLAGNVGIGTTTPDQKLTVKGIIHTQEVRVDLTGAVAPDYVFEKDYNLLPLSEVETYINKNKHLPEVPSAKEMEAEGLNLKEMNLILLKKVEELTLHLIEQNKVIKSQSARIVKLENSTK